MRTRTISATVAIVLAGGGLAIGSEGCGKVRDAVSGKTTTGGQQPAKVISITDGDTIHAEVEGRDERVRLVQIDTPDDGECWEAEATKALDEMIPPGTTITLEQDPDLEDRDRYGRMLRVIHDGRTNINLELVRQGDASVYLYRAQRGRYSGALVRAAKTAKAKGRGAWGGCPQARLDPERNFDSGPS